MTPKRWAHRYPRNRWLLLALAIGAVLLMPVEYRAGAQTAHPHAVLQLAWEAHHGTPRHHHVRKALHPCEEAIAVHHLPSRAATAAHLHTEAIAPIDTNGDVGDPSSGLRFTSTLLAVALSTWVFSARPRNAVRQESLSDGIPEGTATIPEPPPPKL